MTLVDQLMGERQNAINVASGCITEALRRKNMLLFQASQASKDAEKNRLLKEADGIDHELETVRRRRTDIESRIIMAVDESDEAKKILSSLKDLNKSLKTELNKLDDLKKTITEIKNIANLLGQVFGILLKLSTF